MLQRMAELTVRAADLHAADARYHQECYSRFFSSRSRPGYAQKRDSTVVTSAALKLLVEELQSQPSERWDSVQLMARYVELGGSSMRRSVLITALCEELEDLVVLSAPGYRSVIFFKDNATATLKIIKDDDDVDNLDAALDVVAKRIRHDISEMDYKHQKYTTHISKEIADEQVAPSLQWLLGKLSLEEQSLPSILIGNMITSAIKKHPTPLQIALGILFHTKKIITHISDYLVSCSYNELLRFK